MITEGYTSGITMLALLLFIGLAFVILAALVVGFIMAPRATALATATLVAIALVLASIAMPVRTDLVYHQTPPMVVSPPLEVSVAPTPPEAPRPPEGAAGRSNPEQTAPGSELRPLSVVSDSVGKPLSIREITYHGDDITVVRDGILEPPAWILAESTIERQGDNVNLTLSSQRFATAEEARDQLWNATLRPEIQNFLKGDQSASHVNSLTFDGALKLGIVKKEADVVYPLEVGGFTEQVHQVHWQAELNPSIRALIEQSWKPELARRRLLILAAVLGGATLLFGAGSMSARKRQTTT